MEDIILDEQKVSQDYLKGLSSEKDFKTTNIFRARPKGIIIMDTYNNPFYPLVKVEFDTDAYDFIKLEDELAIEYGLSKDRLYMPWHFQLEMQKMKYHCRTTRPLMYHSLMPGYEKYITIMITGNTNKDLYNEKLYKTIAHFILNSLKYQHAWRIKQDEIKLVNLGKNFRRNQLIGLLR